MVTVRTWSVMIGLPVADRGHPVRLSARREHAFCPKVMSVRRTLADGMSALHYEPNSYRSRKISI
jgi:hypothetical protein